MIISQTRLLHRYFQVLQCFCHFKYFSNNDISQFSLASETQPASSSEASFLETPNGPVAPHAEASAAVAAVCLDRLGKVLETLGTEVRKSGGPINDLRGNNSVDHFYREVVTT